MRFIKDNEATLTGLSEETRELTDKMHEELAAAAGKFIRFKQASEVGPFKQIYLAYSQYSGDAAHPTFTALMRHWDVSPTKAEFVIAPEAREYELDETIHLACVAMISVAVAANEMCGYTEAGKQLPKLNARLQTFQQEHYGAATLGGEDATPIIRTQPDDE